MKEKFHVFALLCVLMLLNTGIKAQCTVNLPFKYCFSGMMQDSFPDCWSSNNANWKINNSSNAYGNPPEMKLELSGPLTDTMMLISPLINATNASSLYLEFKHYYNQTSAIFKFSVVSSIDSGMTWDTIWVKDNYASIESELVTVDLSHLAGEEFLLAWIFAGTTTSYSFTWCIDEILVDEHRSCQEPRNLLIDRNNFDPLLSWDTGQENFWLIEWDTSGYSHGTGHLTITDTNHFYLENLLPSTDYEFRVKALCDTISADTSIWSWSRSFRTRCEAQSMPFFDDFSTYTLYTFPDCMIKSYNKWRVENSIYAGGQLPELVCFSNSIMDTLKLSSSIIDAGNSTSIYLSFKQKLTIYSANSVNIFVLVTTDQHLGWDTVWIKNYNTYDPLSEVINIDLSAYVGHKIIVSWVSIKDDASLLWRIDDLSFDEIFLCEAPKNPVVNSTGVNHAVISWTPGGQESYWQIEWDTIGFNTGMGNIVNTNNNIHILTQLEENKNYEYYVRAVCLPPFNMSSPIGPVQFSTSSSGIYKPFNNKFLTVFPTPATNNLNIQNPANTPNTYTLTFTNIQGQLLISGQVNIDKTYTLDLSKCPNGVYFLSLGNENGNYVSKVVVWK